MSCGTLVVENGRITALVHLNDYRIVVAFSLVILGELRAKSTGFHTNYRIDPWIERLAPPEHVNTQQPFFERVGLSADRLFDHEAQKLTQPFRTGKDSARENSLKLG